MSRLHVHLSRLALLLLLGIASESASAQPRGRGWHYDVVLSPDLGRMEVAVCFRAFPARRLVLAAEAGMRCLDVPAPRAGEAALLPAGDGALVPRGLGADGCVRYQVDLEALCAGRGRRATRVGEDVITWPALWLLRPALWPDDVEVTLRFVLPEGVDVAVPWPRFEGAGPAYRLNRHVSDGDGRVAFGRLERLEVKEAGTTLDVALLDAPRRASEAGIRRWLGAAARVVGAFYGGFPVPRVQVLVQPVGGFGEPVLFGQSMRAGGATVHLLLRAAASDEALPGEWVAIHELLHLGVPWTHDTEAWLTEGFVMYYTEILRARGGFVDPRGGWQLLYEGFLRGMRGQTERSLEAQSARMHRDHAYQRVYWGGAAIALLIDLELRTSSSGERSLDDVMRFWQTRLLGTGPHTGLALLEAADQWLGRPLCVPIARRILAEREMPDLTQVWQRLGLGVSQGQVFFRDGAALADLRRAIMDATGR